MNDSQALETNKALIDLLKHSEFENCDVFIGLSYSPSCGDNKGSVHDFKVRLKNQILTNNEFEGFIGHELCVGAVTILKDAVDENKLRYIDESGFNFGTYHDTFIELDPSHRKVNRVTFIESKKQIINEGTVTKPNWVKKRFEINRFECHGKF